MKILNKERRNMLYGKVNSATRELRVRFSGIWPHSPPKNLMVQFHSGQDLDLNILLKDIQKYLWDLDEVKRKFVDAERMVKSLLK